MVSLMVRRHGTVALTAKCRKRGSLTTGRRNVEGGKGFGDHGNAYKGTTNIHSDFVWNWAFDGKM